MNAALRFDDLCVGDAVPDSVQSPTRVQLFRYSAVTWNGHRIHYDRDYAASEGYPDVLVHSHLHGAFLTRFVVGLAGDPRRVERIDHSVRRFAVPGDTLICRGTVTATSVAADGSGLVDLAVEEVRAADGAVCAPGTARIRLPRDPGAAP